MQRQQQPQQQRPQRASLPGPVTGLASLGRYVDDQAQRAQYYRDQRQQQMIAEEREGTLAAGNELGGIATGVRAGIKSLAAPIVRAVGPSVLEGTADKLESFAPASAQSLRRMAVDPAGDIQRRSEAQVTAQQANVADREFGAARGWLNETVPGVAQSMSQMVALAPTGMAGLAAGFAATTADQEYTTARDLGLSDQEAGRFAFNQGVLEAVPMLAFSGAARVLGKSQLAGVEGMFAKGFQEKFAKEVPGTFRTWLKKEFTPRVLSELAEEEITSIAQTVNTAATLPGRENAADWVGEDGTVWNSPMMDVVRKTFSQTILTMGVAETPNAVRTFISSPSRKNFNKLSKKLTKGQKLPQADRDILAQQLMQVGTDPVDSTPSPSSAVESPPVSSPLPPATVNEQVAQPSPALTPMETADAKYTRQVAEKIAFDNGLNADEVEIALPDMLKEARADWQEREAAKKELRERTRKNSAAVNRQINAGKDSQDMDGIDEIAREMAPRYPGIFGVRSEGQFSKDERDDTIPRAAELRSEKVLPEPTLDSQSVVDRILGVVGPARPANESAAAETLEPGVDPTESSSALESVAAPLATTGERKSLVPDDLPDATAANTAQWFHGSPVEVSEPSSSFSDPAGLLGSGFYMTDDPTVARGGYAKKDGFVNAFRVQVRDVINLEKPLPEKAKQVFRDSVPDEYLDNAPFDTGTGAEVITSISEAVQDESQGERIPKSEYYEMFQHLEASLREAGFDALTHIGGRRAGKGKRDHRVLILLDPQNEYSGDASLPVTVTPSDTPTTTETGEPGFQVGQRVAWKSKGQLYQGDVTAIEDGKLRIKLTQAGTNTNTKGKRFIDPSDPKLNVVPAENVGEISESFDDPGSPPLASEITEQADESQPELFPASESPESTPLTGALAKDAAARELEVPDFKPVPLTELVQIVEEFTGQGPKMKKLRGKRGAIRTIEGVGVLDVALDPNTVMTTAERIKTISHEIGHIWDFQDDMTTKRGNLIGRIFSLHEVFRGKEFAGLRNKEMRDQLKELSMAWRPWDPKTATKKERTYRNDSKELYADAISVLMNNPELLRDTAPAFFEALMDNLSTKPDIVTSIVDIQALLNGTPEALAAKRRERTLAGFQTAEENKRADAQARKDDSDRAKANYDFHKNMAVALLDKGRQAKSKSLTPELMYQIDELGSIDNTSHVMLKRTTREIWQPMYDRGITDDQIGEYLLQKRLYTSDKEHRDRVGLAQPLGFDETTTDEQLADLRKQLGEENWAFTESQVRKWHDEILAPILERARATGLWSEERAEKLQGNKDYVTFAVAHYMGSQISASIHEQVGTFSQVANPKIATEMKMVSLIRLIELNDVRSQVVEDMLKAHDTEILRIKLPHDVIEPRRSQQPSKSGNEFITRIKDGKIEWYEVPRAVAAAFIAHDVGGIARSGRALSLLTYGLLHPLYVTYSPKFVLRNIPRDITRTYRLAGARHNLSLREIIKATWKARKDAGAFARGEYVPDIEAMLEDKSYSLPYTDLIGQLGESVGNIADPNQSTRDKLLDIKSHTPESRKVRRAILGALAGIYGIPTKLPRIVTAVPRFIKAEGEKQELSMKLAGWRLLGDRGVTGRKRAYEVRKFVGTPDWSQKGTFTDMTNPLMMYSKTAWNAMDAEYQTATDSKSRASYYYRNIPTVLIPAALRTLARGAPIGALIQAFGADDEEKKGVIQRWAERMREYFSYIPSWDQDNSVVIPMGWTHDKNDRTWKPHYVTIPMDENQKALYRITSHLFDAILEAGGDPDVAETPSGSTHGALTGVSKDAFNAVVTAFNPIANTLWGWTEAAQGNNPNDRFRDRGVMTDRVYNTNEFWPKVGAMTSWTWGQTGAIKTYTSIVGDVAFPNPYDDADASTLEFTHRNITRTTGLDAMFKISDRGLSEEMYLQMKVQEMNDTSIKYHSVPDEVLRLTSEQNMLSQLQRTDKLDKVGDKIRLRALSLWRARDYTPRMQAIKETEDQDERTRIGLEMRETGYTLDTERFPEQYIDAITYDATAKDAKDGDNSRRDLARTILKRDGYDRAAVTKSLRDRMAGEAKREAERAQRPFKGWNPSKSTAYRQRIRRLRWLNDKPKP